MPTDLLVPGHYMKGEVRTFNVSPLRIKWSLLTNGAMDDVWEMDVVRKLGPDGVPEGWSGPSEFSHNDFLYEWGAIFANLLMRRGLNYGIGGMYLEFENTASPGDPVAAPTFTRAAGEGVEYYNALVDSADRDYLRVPLVASDLAVGDEVKFPKGNLASFFAQTSGVTGVHGKPFSDADNSVVFGGALVAFVDSADPTRDLVLSRFYLATDRQMPKLATSEVGFQWRLNLL